ncbi:CAF17-like 4Fe-4S cluster assembly/insertion protein YgfZ [Oceanomicrobium pacificus]|uniref:Folate-binding protein n=1 Tax=Oceanomicrobium pacificus TaxID=2692916 RepID=A0A6B0TXR6_9RHOB|nr:folate-binding protein YgfZ [Oceanomicrobium pacificus]MXU66082.1 folate-binding protein [Oceanomicrobium pacificus]
MQGYVRLSRQVLRLGDVDAERFLQDLVTNDITRTGDGAVYAALLSPQGKYLFDFFILRGEAGDGFLLDVAAERAAALAQRLSMYRLRAKVSIDQTDLQVVQLFGPVPDQGRAVPDPRDPELGHRLYLPAGADLSALGAELPLSALDARRVALGVPETGAELVPDETYILEAGFERLGGVDFRKGCYVGQEVTARMKHKTELRKGLVRVAVDGPAPAPGTLVERDGRPAGTLYTVAEGAGLAHLRFDRAEGEMVAGDARVTRL